MPRKVKRKRGITGDDFIIEYYEQYYMLGINFEEYCKGKGNIVQLSEWKTKYDHQHPKRDPIYIMSNISINDYNKILLSNGVLGQNLVQLYDAGPLLGTGVMVIADYIPIGAHLCQFGIISDIPSPFDSLYMFQIKLPLTYPDCPELAGQIVNIRVTGHNNYQIGEKVNDGLPTDDHPTGYEQNCEIYITKDRSTKKPIAVLRSTEELTKGDILVLNYGKCYWRKFLTLFNCDEKFRKRLLLDMERKTKKPHCF